MTFRKQQGGVVRHFCMGEGLLQPGHLLVILAIALLLFGPQKLPQLGRGLGEAIRGFREGIRSTSDMRIDGEALNRHPAQDESAPS